LLDVLMEDTNHRVDRFIADIFNSAKVWVSHSEYTSSESNLISGILPPEI
jgi:hypothetical protein